MMMRNFNIDYSSNNCNLSIEGLINNSILKRSNNNTKFVDTLINYKLQLENRDKNNPNYSICEFYDFSKSKIDPSVRHALYKTSEKLIEKQCLSTFELTYYFCEARFNFLTSIKIKETIQNVIEQSLFYKILSRLEQLSSLFLCDENNNIKLLCESTNSNFRSLKETAEKFCFHYLNIVTIPIPSIHGKDSIGILINDTTKSDSNLFSDIISFYDIKSKEKQIILEENKLKKVGKKRNIDENVLEEVSNLTPSQFQKIQSFIPAKMTFMLQYLLAVTCNDPDKLLTYGISQLRKRSLILRMSESIQEGDIIKERLQNENINIETIKKHLRLSCEKSKIFMHKQKILANKSLNIKNSDPEVYKLIIDCIQTCARNLHGNSKKRDDTPVDAIILDKDDYTAELGLFSGGVVNRIACTVNQMLLDNNYDFQLSVTTIYSMFKDANIQFKKSKNTFTQSRLDQHYCAAVIKIITILHQLFSNEIAYLSADAKSLIKVETAGSLKGAVIQLMSEHVTVRCHDQGVDVLGKICLYVIELIGQHPNLYNFEASEPTNRSEIDKVGYINVTENMIPGWKKESHTKATDGLAVAFAHHHNLYPETGARNASDICEMIKLYLPYFQTKEGKLKSTIFLQVDNSKGAKDSQTRFVWVLMFLKFDLDCVVIVSNAGGFSKYNPVEKCNGALSNRINQFSIEFEGVEINQYMSQEQLNASMEKSLDRVVDVCDYTSCNRTGGIDVFKAKHPPSYDDFKFLPEEISNFLTCKDKNNFKSKDMVDFGNGEEVTNFYNTAWNILHATTGINKCVHLTKHTMTIVKNLNNNNLSLPLRGSIELHELLKSFNYNIPMPIASTNPSKQNTEGNNKSPSYTNTEELLNLSPQQRNEASLKYELPGLLMNSYLLRNATFLDEYINNNKQLSETKITELQLLLRANKRDIHTDLAHRIAKNIHIIRQSELKRSQLNRGIELLVKNYFLQSDEYDKKFTCPMLKKCLKTHRQTNYQKCAKPVLVEKVYSLLVEKKIINPDNAVVLNGEGQNAAAPNQLQLLLDAAIALNRAEEAEQDLNNNLQLEQTLHNIYQYETDSDDDSENF